MGTMHGERQREEETQRKETPARDDAARMTWERKTNDKKEKERQQWKQKASLSLMECMPLIANAHGSKARGKHGSKARGERKHNDEMMGTPRAKKEKIMEGNGEQ